MIKSSAQRLLVLAFSMSCLLPLGSCGLSQERVIDGRHAGALLSTDGRISVLLFITPDCPIANRYVPQVLSLVKRYADRSVDFWLVHTDPEIEASQARHHAKEYGYDLTLILDKRHDLVRKFGVTVTPEAVVLGTDGTMQYRGRINNWYGDLGRWRTNVSRHEVRDAIDALLAGRRPAVSRATPIGCFIEQLVEH